jgi:hypothetical protein
VDDIVIREVCLGPGHAISRLRSLYDKAGGVEADWLRRHEVKTRDEAARKVAEVKRIILDGFREVHGTEHPVDNWPRMQKVCEAVARSMEPETLDRIRTLAVEANRKRSAGQTMSFEDKFILTNYTAKGILRNGPSLVAMCPRAVEKKESFEGGTL